MMPDPPLNVIIIGTGIGGLTAALALNNPSLANDNKRFSVTILEATPTLQTIGGTIAVQANGCRMLDHLGVYDRFKAICKETPFHSAARRWEDGHSLSVNDDQNYAGRWGYPLWNVHRAEYQRTLYEATIERGVAVRLSCRVESINETEGSVTLATGEVVQADVIIAADAGVKSVVRKSIFPDAESTALIDTGMDDTRVNIPEAIIRSDPSTNSFADEIALWFGPGNVVANIPFRIGNDWFVGYDFTTPRTKGSSSSRAMAQKIENVSVFFEGWAPLMQKLLQHIEDNNIEMNVWQIQETRLNNWVSPSGKVALLGDACHAFTPFLGSGATMAVEDAVTLAECLVFTPPAGAEHISIADRLRTYQDIRHTRVYAVQKRSNDMGKMYSVPDGPMQQFRDAKLKMYLKDVQTQERGMEWFQEPPAADASPAEWDPWMMLFDAANFVSPPSSWDITTRWS